MTTEWIFTNNSALHYVDRYEDFDDFEENSNIDKEEFNEKLENGYFQELTLGTYNGATDTFTPWTPTDQNLIDAILNEIHLLELDDVEVFDSDSQEPPMSALEKIESWCGNNHIVVIGDRVFNIKE